jgi:hypothetical protein
MALGLQAVRLYPDIPRSRANAILGDVLVLVLLLLFAWLGLKVHATVAELTSLPRAIGDTGGSIQRGFESAGSAVGGVPVVGDALGEALRNAGSDAGGQIEATAASRVEDVNRVATLLGVLTFLLPAIAVLSRFLPDRITRARRLTAAARVIGPALTPERERTLAMRAAYGLPYERLVRYTPDPLGDLEAGRYGDLAAAALDDAGLRPRGRSRTAAP